MNARVDPKNTRPSDRRRVLILDDDVAIHRVACRALTRAGFDVVSAYEGGEAIRSYHQAQDEGRPFAVVIFDLDISGGMGGRETISVLRRYDPLIKAIVSSGDVNDPVVLCFQDYGFDEAVHKPYKPHELVEAVIRLTTSVAGHETARGPASSA